MTIRDLILKAEKRGQTRAEIAEALGVSPYTVDSWAKPDTSSSHRDAPEWARVHLEVLLTGKPVTYVQGAIAVTYQRAEDL